MQKAQRMYFKNNTVQVIFQKKNILIAFKVFFYAGVFSKNKKFTKISFQMFKLFISKVFV